MQTTLKDTAQLVSKLNELKKHINTDHIQSMSIRALVNLLADLDLILLDYKNWFILLIDIKQVGSQVESISSVHIDQKLMANQMEERYNNLLFAYDETVSLFYINIYLILSHINII